MLTGLVRLGLAGIWITLAAAKVAEPRPFYTWLERGLPVEPGVAQVMAWMVVVAEFGLGIAFLTPSRLTRLHRLLARVSWMAAALAVVVTILTRNRGDCGCFGAVLAAKVPSRLIVAGALMWLSFESHRVCAAEVEMAESP